MCSNSSAIYTTNQNVENSIQNLGAEQTAIGEFKVERQSIIQIVVCVLKATLDCSACVQSAREVIKEEERVTMLKEELKQMFFC